MPGTKLTLKLARLLCNALPAKKILLQSLHCASNVLEYKNVCLNFFKSHLGL